MTTKATPTTNEYRPLTVLLELLADGGRETIGAQHWDPAAPFEGLAQSHPRDLDALLDAPMKRPIGQTVNEVVFARAMRLNNARRRRVAQAMSDLAEDIRAHAAGKEASQMMGKVARLSRSRDTILRQAEAEEWS